MGKDVIIYLKLETCQTDYMLTHYTLILFKMISYSYVPKPLEM